MAKVVIKYLLKIWPIINASKEVLFLQEIEELLEMASGVDMKDIHVEFFQRLARTCVVSNHF